MIRSLRANGACVSSVCLVLLLQEIGFTQVNTIPFGTRELELSRR